MEIDPWPKRSLTSGKGTPASKNSVQCVCRKPWILINLRLYFLQKEAKKFRGADAFKGLFFVIWLKTNHLFIFVSSFKPEISFSCSVFHLISISMVSLSAGRRRMPFLVLGGLITANPNSSTLTVLVILIVFLEKSTSSQVKAKASPFRIPVKASNLKKANHLKGPAFFYWNTVIWKVKD